MLCVKVFVQCSIKISFIQSEYITNNIVFLCYLCFHNKNHSQEKNENSENLTNE